MSNRVSVQAAGLQVLAPSMSTRHDNQANPLRASLWVPAPSVATRYSRDAHPPRASPCRPTRLSSPHPPAAPGSRCLRPASPPGQRRGGPWYGSRSTKRAAPGRLPPRCRRSNTRPAFTSRFLTGCRLYVCITDCVICNEAAFNRHDRQPACMRASPRVQAHNMLCASAGVRPS